MPRPVPFLILVAAAQAGNAQGIGDIEAAIAERQWRAEQTDRPIHDTKSQSGCTSQSGEDEVVICAPTPRRYELDPDAMKAAEPPAPPPKGDPRTAVNIPQCGTGGNICDSGQIPVSAIALAGAKAAIAAIQGEDWKQVFRRRPDEYERYLRAQRQRQARARGIAEPEAQTYR